MLLFLSESAVGAASSAASDVSSSSEHTLSEAVHGFVEKPEETFSALGGFFSHLWERFVNSLPTILLALVVLFIGMIATRLSVKLLTKGLSKTKLDLTVTKFVTQIVKIFLYVLVFTIALSMLGIPATSVITVIGTAGVAIGLALQDSLKNVAGGFLLLITKPFKIGDYIITNGVEGTVTQISIIHTKLNSSTNQAILIPNGLAVNAVVVNNTANGTRRVDIPVSISYDDDYATARDVILELVNDHPLVIKSAKNLVRMKEHGDSAIILTCRVWCRTEDYWTVYFDLVEQIREAFIENGIEIPFNQLSVHIED